VAILRGETARAEGVDLAPASKAIREAEVRGESWSVVVDAGQPLGVLRFRAPVGPGVARAVASLRAMGVEVVMVTGDHPAAARVVATELGVRDVHADVDPSGKVALVQQYRHRGHHVAFVGDGINDAAALAAADVGIAIGTGSDVAREAGQVLLVHSDFSGVPAALGLARRTVAKVRGNLLWAIGYNLVLLPIAAGALVPWLGLGIYRILPIAGALAMGLSSTTVVLNSLSLRRRPSAARPTDLSPARGDSAAVG
jgi:P-type E1-E2 ATPase